MNRRQFLRITGTFAATGLGLYAYGHGYELHDLEVVHRRIPIAGLPKALEGARVVQLSDLHVGFQVSDAYLVRALRRAATLRPDLVVVTGDVVTWSDARQLGQLAHVLSHLPHGRLATLAILGNHDYGPHFDDPGIAARVARVIEGAGARVLRNEAVEVSGLTIAGFDDLWARRFDPAPVLDGHDPSAPSIALVHNPDAVDRPGWSRFRGLVLAGHTHGGQCKLPLLPPPILPIHDKRYAAGEIDLRDGRRLYVNRGVGHLLPIRFDVRPEITVITLAAA